MSTAPWDLTDLERWDAARDRSGQIALGPSDTDRCLRQSGFSHHGAPKTDDRSRGLMLLGSLLHLGWGEIVKAAGDPMRQSEVTIEIPGLGADGHADEVDYRTKTVVDLKTTSDRRWVRWVTVGPERSAWDQVELYAYGLWWKEHHDTERADVDPEQPWTLRIMALNRETGSLEPFEQPADHERGARLAERLVDRQARLDASTSPEDLPREGAGPDRGFPCDYCDFVTVCWPEPEDGRSPQSETIAHDPAAIAAAAEDYLAHREIASKAKSGQDDARAFLQGIPEGDYGTVRIKWSGGRPLPPKPDVDAIVEALTLAGVDVPTKAARSARSIGVSRVPSATLSAADEILGGSA